MGHADHQRLKYKNPFLQLDFSRIRAVNIVRYLISKGVDPSRIYAASFAAHRAASKKLNAQTQTNAQGGDFL